MRLYLAGAFTILSNFEREEMLSKRFPEWNRLMSFYFLDMWEDNLFRIKQGLPKKEKIKKVKGFFEVDKKENKPKMMKRLGLAKKEDLEKDWCELCGLHKTCKSPKMEVHGNGKKEILILAESPGKTEDEQGEQLVGKTGILLRNKLASYGIDLEEDCFKFNVVSCHPGTDAKGHNRTPNSKEIQCCRSRVLETIKKLKPKYIITLGECAIESLYGERFNKEKIGISIWRKRCIPDQEFQAFILPLYHPSFVLHNDHDDMIEKVYDLDLKWTISCLNKKFPEYQEPTLHNLTNYDAVVERLQYIKNDVKLLCYDYETTSLRPQLKGSKIVSISVSYDKLNSYAFPFGYNDFWTKEQLANIRELWISIITDISIKKVNQNISFEESWNRHYFYARDDGWYSDTMQLAHLLDEMRGRSSSLELQSYFHLGIKSYKDETEHYKKDKNGSGFNRMEECPLDILLTYNNRDTHYTFLIDEKQQKELKFKKDIQQAYKLYFNGILAFNDTEETGLPIKEAFYEEQDELLEKEIKEKEFVLLHSNEAKKFKEKFNREISLTSPKDLQELFFNILGLKAIRKTKTGNSVDEKSLKKLQSNFADELLAIRKLEKLKGTYLNQFLQHYDWTLYPHFSLLARTGRSEGSRPNFQNIPIHDERANHICRGGIIPNKGYQLVDLDYKGAEVRGMACLSQDPELIKYILDPKTDMHRDAAMDIFILFKDDITKDLRYLGKNGFVFAQFYGDYFGNIAPKIWESIEEGLKLKDGSSVKDHLKKRDIKNYKDFEAHMKEVEQIFWSRLQVTDYWRKNTIKEYYKEHGYSSMPSGCRRGGFIDRKQLMNTPVQNTAFTWMLWAYAEVNRIRKEENWKSRILGQVHDDLVMSVHPDELKHVLSTAIKVMTKDLLVQFPWIIVPIEVEISICPIDAPWTQKKELSNEELAKLLSN